MLETEEKQGKLVDPEWLESIRGSIITLFDDDNPAEWELQLNILG